MLMKKQNTADKTILLALVLSSLLLSGCSTTPASSEDTAGAAAMDGNLFASLNELDYLAPQEASRITPDDILDIKVFQADELSGKVRVASDGNISLPLIGTLGVGGLTPIEAENRIKGLLGQKYLQNPQVTVLVEGGFTKQRVTVEGQVQKPGVYPIEGSFTLLQSIALAGGLADLASPDRVVLFRRKGNQMKAYRLDMNAIREGKMRDPYVRGDDRIVAHRSDSRYWFKEVKSMISGLVSF
jgi:polysaccharide export outer membrane protein